MKNLQSLLMVLLVAGTFFTTNAQSKKEIADAKKQLTALLKAEKLTEDRLVKFDTLDFVVYSRQEWNRLHETHAKNIKVAYPDGSVTIGIEDHIKQLDPMFVFAPDTKIRVHPIRFGSGNYTAVTGVVEGTFTKPMNIGGGKTIPPTGKSFKLPMCTIGIWKDGVMIEEQLYWDNQSFMKQLGLMN